MAKRKNRLRPIEHERRQVELLKTLEPIETPAHYKPLSDALVDLVTVALEEVYDLEAGKEPNPDRYQQMQDLLEQLPNLL